MINYIIIFILLFVFELFYLKLAGKLGIIDKPNHRSAHIKPTIRGGGIIYLPALLLFVVFSKGFEVSLALLIAVFLIAIISFVDDMKPLSTKIRILIHFISFSIIFHDLGFFDELSIINLVIIITSYIFSLGYLNIYNFMDGINGMTFLNSLVTYVSFFIINSYIVEFINSKLLAVFILASLVFGIFNFRKKPSCFAGDVGSITIGFTIIYFIIKLFLTTNNYIVFLMLSVYLLDGGWTIIERIFRKENIFKAHRRHLYQLFANELKIPHLKISFLYGIIQIVLNSIVIYLLYSNNSNFLIIGLIALLLSILYLRIKVNTSKKVTLFKNE